MRAPERVETPRLVLRKPALADARAIFARYASDPEVTRYLSWPRHESPDATRAFLEFSNAEWERWPAGPYLVESRGDARLLGGSGFGFQTAVQAVTGYVFAKDAWGLGYATETLTAIIEIARRIGVHRLSAHCHPEHHASQRVLDKCGFLREAVLQQPNQFPNLQPGELCDVVAYALVLR